MKACLSKVETETGRLLGVNLIARPDDVFVVTPPKCGTTWVQQVRWHALLRTPFSTHAVVHAISHATQIMHSLRSRGDMSFEEISLTIPCLEMAYDGGVLDLQADQGYRPRCFKTHLWYKALCLRCTPIHNALHTGTVIAPRVHATLWWCEVCVGQASCYALVCLVCRCAQD